MYPLRTDWLFPFAVQKGLIFPPRIVTIKKTMKQKILLVEDEPELQEMFVSLFTSETSTIVVVDSAAEAQRALQRAPFAEIVTDDLEGEWLHVVHWARQYAGAIPITLWAWGTAWQEQADKMAIQFVDKARFSPQSIRLLSRTQ